MARRLWLLHILEMIASRRSAKELAVALSVSSVLSVDSCLLASIGGSPLFPPLPPVQFPRFAGKYSFFLQHSKHTVFFTSFKELMFLRSRPANAMRVGGADL
jgi:hypothetical protein